MVGGNRRRGLGQCSSRAGRHRPHGNNIGKAWSTLISSSITSARGSIRKKPLVGLGVVGTYTLTLVAEQACSALHRPAYQSERRWSTPQDAGTVLTVQYETRCHCWKQCVRYFFDTVVDGFDDRNMGKQFVPLLHHQRPATLDTKPPVTNSTDATKITPRPGMWRRVSISGATVCGVTAAKADKNAPNRHRANR